MFKKKHLLTIMAATCLSATMLVPAHAVVAPLVLADRFIKSETQKAIATPRHVEWCAKKYPGYRPQWNNYKIENGRVAWCASPYYTPAWMRWRQNTN